MTPLLFVLRNLERVEMEVLHFQILLELQNFLLFGMQERIQESRQWTKDPHQVLCIPDQEILVI